EEQKAKDAEVKPEAKQAKKEEKPKEQKEEQKAKDAEVKPEAKQAKKEEKPKEQKQASANAKEQKQGEVFKVQIGAFRTEQNALKLANMAKEKGYNSEIVKDGNFHKIVLTLKSEDIRADIRKLKREFGDAILVK
ncbi:MAG: SPOR domain-containing protein, partial [Aquificaceae bacterium]|nr:SPOR domain-containing protein [Aquificaceae bacterium]